MHVVGQCNEFFERSVRVAEIRAHDDAIAYALSINLTGLISLEIFNLQSITEPVKPPWPSL